MKKPIELLEALLEEIYRLKEAEQLLIQVWTQCGAYGDKLIDKNIWYKIQDYFGFFDDGE